MSFHLNLANNNLKARCENAIFWPAIVIKDVCVICPKKGSKKFFNSKTDIVAANDNQIDIWSIIDQADHIFCYDFDNFPLETQAMIYYLKNKEVYIWAKPKYIRDAFNIADNDYLYQIYIDPKTTVTVSGNIKWQNLPKDQNAQTIRT